MLSSAAQGPITTPEFRSADDCLTLGAMDELRDRELMQRYGTGDEKAFEVLYARHKGPLYRFLNRRCFNKETADEIFQEVWTKVIRARTQYEPTARFTTWLYQLARNAYVDHVRHVKRRITLVHSSDDAALDVPSQQAGPDEHFKGAELARDFAAALDALPREQQETFLLHTEAGLTLPQIATVTDVERETAKSRLRYAVRKLRKALVQDDDQTEVSA